MPEPSPALPVGAINLRLATIGDSAVLLHWRNDPLTRQNSHSTTQVELASHEAWLEKSLADPTRIIFIGETNGAAVGTVRCDCRDGFPARIELSWTVAPEHRGHGLGRKLVGAAVELFPAHELYAEIKRGNTASLAIAGSIGMKQVGTRDEVTLWVRPPQSAIAIARSPRALFGTNVGQIPATR